MSLPGLNSSESAKLLAELLLSSGGVKQETKTPATERAAEATEFLELVELRAVAVEVEVSEYAEAGE